MSTPKSTKQKHQERELVNYSIFSNRENVSSNIIELIQSIETWLEFKMSSDEEPDYMSDDFLAHCIPQDVKPGLKRVSFYLKL
jgi:hypothetical protein